MKAAEVENYDPDVRQTASMGQATPPHRPRRRQQNPNFLARDDDGSCRLRMRFEGDEAALMEEASGDMPVLDWMHKTLQEGARRDIEARRQLAEEDWTELPPPDEDDFASAD